MEAQQPTTDVTVRKATSMATLQQSMMDEEKATSRDIIIPKILVMQPVSKYVHDEKAKMGELRGSLETNLVAEKGKAAEFIAFHRFKTRITFKKVKGKQEFVGQQAWTPQHEGTPRLEIIDGIEHEHFETLNYYVLLPQDIVAGMPFPYLLSFRSTGYKTGRMLETFRTKLQMANKPLPFKVFNLGAEQTENEKGTFYVPTISMGRDSTEVELTAVKQWYELLKASNVKVDDSDLQDDAAPKADTTTVNTNF